MWIPLVMDPSRNDGSASQLWFCEHYVDGFDPQLLWVMEFEERVQQVFHQEWIVDSIGDGSKPQ